MTRLMTRIVIVLTCMAALATTARAQGIAELVPSDTAVLLTIDNLNDALKAHDADPMAQQVRAWLAGNRPMAWRMLEGVMEMDGRQLIETYFGKQFAVLMQRPGDNQPAVMLSRIDADAGARLIDRLELQAQGQAGDFRVYQTGDGKARMAISNQWLLMSGIDHAEYFQHVLDRLGKGDTLAGDATYKQWIARLPRSRLMTLYVRNDEQQQVHVMGLSLDEAGAGRNVSLHYAGHNPQFDAAAQRLGDSPQPAFEPLPVGTLGAMDLNLWDANAQLVGLLDRLIAPQQAQADLLPQLQPPLLAFVGQVEPGGDYPARSAPVIGLAVKMRSGEAAGLLNRAMNNLALLANVATMQWGTPPLTPQAMSQGGDTFTVVDAGPALVQKTGRAEAAAVRVTFGAVGDWYMVCTHDGYFRKALAAKAGGPGSFAAANAVKAIATPAPDGSLAHLAIDPAVLAEHLGLWLDHLDAQRVAAGLPLDVNGQRVMMTLGAIQKTLPRFSSIWGRLQIEPDGVMVGRVEMVAGQ